MSKILSEDEKLHKKEWNETLEYTKSEEFFSHYPLESRDKILGFQSKRIMVLDSLILRLS